MIAYGSSLDQGGPFARSAEDCALLLQTMSGFDRRDSTSAEQAVPDFSAALGKGVEGLRIGLPREYFAEGLDGKIAAVIETAVDELRKLGAEVSFASGETVIEDGSVGDSFLIANSTICTSEAMTTMKEIRRR